MLAIDQSPATGGEQAVRNAEILACGRAVITDEAEALEALSHAIDENFVAAVEALMGTDRRVVVSGLGKSGHVGRKIAASFASTGTPAFFMHAAEAAHGDLGMIMPGDTLLLLSMSGETRELKQVVTYAAEAGITIVAIGSKPSSTIMQLADVKLLIPPVREACPENISPTTSAIMMLAMGDALAIAMMNQRGVSRTKLNMLHPGGAIGQRLARVSSLMHSKDELPLVKRATPMRDVVLTITAHSLGIAGVIDDAGSLIGVITDGDLRRHADNLFDRDAQAVMTQNPSTVDVSCFVEDALQTIEANKITALFVTHSLNPRLPVGLIHIHDILRSGLR
ncbi:MAG: KpsF/GutQ family sugar-phosphate isomerase [Sphingomonas sp. 28-62-20]|uniref:KpsF/GutQ family sugar-phosphate isomerase n=1 Tax=Sphingomonas sp. 28-62-20 TaxID=1970433 RepID=UPI000BCBB4EE|nr:MAG: KpsF/GutQ family sugar-phosphate isomerase [Sphingomonas sp. 28-62-20]